MPGRIIAGAALVAGGLVLQSASALADLKVCNASRLPITVAVAYKDKDRGWLTTGWWVLQREDCEVLVTGSLNGKEVEIVAEGHLPDFNWYWHYDWPRCVSEPSPDDHFLIYQDQVRGDCKAAGHAERRFWRVPANLNDYTRTYFNPYPLLAREEREAKAKERFWECNGCPEMVVVPTGELVMGSPENEPERFGDEGPRHKVAIRQRVAVSKGAITRDQYEQFVTATGHATGDKCLGWKDGKWTAEGGQSFRNPGFAQAGNHPAVCVSFDDAKTYLAWISKQTGKPYRLLTEAEWEYVTRAGTESPFWWGSPISTAQANYNGTIVFPGGAKGEFRQKTVPAYDGFIVNPWNLFIGEGNAAEWVEDCWNKSYQGAPSDGSAWTKGDCSRHVVRGGSWASSPMALRSAARMAVQHDVRSNDLGFRVARTIGP